MSYTVLYQIVPSSAVPLSTLGGREDRVASGLELSARGQTHNRVVIPRSAEESAVADSLGATGFASVFSVIFRLCSSSSEKPVNRSRSDDMGQPSKTLAQRVAPGEPLDLNISRVSLVGSRFAFKDYDNAYRN